MICPPLICRSAVGSSAAEAFVIIAIATILLTRLYLELTNYPQIGGGNLHIAHALYGGALMMLALVIGWMTLGFGARLLSVLLGGIGFGLFLDEIGKFVTKDNDYFYGPAAEMMYVLVVLILLGARIVRDIRPFSARECLATAATIAAEGLSRGLPEHRREIGLLLVDQARSGGADDGDTERVRALLLSADSVSDRAHTLQERALALIPGFFRSPRWVPVVGWLLVFSALAGVVFGVFGVAMGGYLYEGEHLRLEFDGFNPGTAILLLSAVLTLGMALPAMIARDRTDAVWPLRWLRNAALTFVFLNALVDFATKGFGALLNIAIGLFAIAVLAHQLDVTARRAIRDVTAIG